MMDDARSVLSRMFAEQARPSLSLELLCGSAQVDPEHAGYFDPAQGCHPKHEAVRQWAEANGIGFHIEQNVQKGEHFSDAYLYFEPEQIEDVASALNEIGIEGDILDINAALPNEQLQHVEAIADQEGWQIG